MIEGEKNKVTESGESLKEWLIFTSVLFLSEKHEMLF